MVLHAGTIGPVPPVVVLSPWVGREREAVVMRTHVTVTRHVATDPWPVVERFLRSPEYWLPLPARPTTDAAFVTTARVGPLLHAVRVEVSDAWTITDAVTRRLAWVPSDATGRPSHSSPVPGFAGQLTVQHLPGEITASLEGAYEPPGGALGAALDRALLHRTGDAMAATLLDDVLIRLRSPANEEAPR